MSSPRRGRSTRDRPAKPPLSERAIVDAALAILRSDGLEALTMRKVAAALDTAAGSLYVYVDGRDGLVRTVFDRVIGTVDLDEPDATRWRAQLQALLQRLRTALIEHPGIAAAAMIDPPRTPAVLRLLENLLGILFAGGFEPQDAVWTADILSAQVTYSAIEAELRRAGPDAIAGEVTANVAGLSADEFPLLTGHARALVSGDVDTRFRFAVDAVVDGVLHRDRRPVGGA